MNQYPDKQVGSQVNGSQTKASAAYQASFGGLGDGGIGSFGMSSHSAGLHNSGKINSYAGVGGATAASGTTQQQMQYRGYSPSKPKWKANNLGMPQTNNLMGGSSVTTGGISHVQGISAGGHHNLRNKAGKQH